MTNISYNSTASREADLEKLSTAFDANTRAYMSRHEAATESRLMDAAIACGMSHRENDLHGWVATRLAAWLVAA